MVLCGAALLSVAILGLTLAFQGWRSRFFAFDLVPYVEEATALLQQGRLPEKGALSSFASYTPPGPAWLLLPGMLTVNDPRLYEFAGSGALYLGALAGVFALTALCAPPRFALLAAALWGLSESGVFFGHSLWPRGHPFFFVWMVYFTIAWIRRRNAAYLAAALVTWAAGMLVFLEIAPALVILPAAWVLYRPPLGPRFIAAAAAVSFLLWAPYLRFERGRNFMDLRSQILRQEVRPEPNAGWCDPSLLPTDWASRPAEETPHLRASLRKVAARRMELAPSMAAANFESTAPGGTILLAGAMVAALGAASLAASPPVSPRVLQLIGLLALAASLVVNPWTVSRFLSADGVLEFHVERLLQFGGAAAFLLGVSLHRYRRQFHGSLKRIQVRLNAAPNVDNLKLAALSLVLPWAALLLAVEGPRPERFWWLWSVQAAVLAAALALVRPAALRIALAGCLLAAVFANDLTISRIRSWKEDGWSGQDVSVMGAIDRLAESVKAKGVRHASIGYDIPFYRFMATFHGADSRYKVGGELDFLLLQRHGIANTNRCAEGFSTDDEFRIVQRTGEVNPAASIERLPVAPDPEMHPIYSDADYTLLERPK